MIHDFLIECGIDADVCSDRKDSPYVNVGDIKSRKERMQFWITNRGIAMFVGTKMGRWYTESGKSPYLVSNGKYKEIENKLLFPTMDIMKDFVKKVSQM